MKVKKQYLCIFFYFMYNKHMENKVTVLIDGDGCPVIKKAISISKARKIAVKVFIDTAHVLNDSYAEVIMVDKGPDSVDFALVNQINENDIVITQDYGLASMALARKAKALSQNGLIYSEFNIDSLLASRHLSQVARRTKSNHKFKGPKKRRESDNEGFATSFIKLLENAE